MKSRAQVEAFYAKKLNPDQLKEEMVYEKDMIITNLKGKLDDLRAKELALEDRIFSLEQRNLVIFNSSIPCPNHLNRNFT